MYQIVLIDDEPFIVEGLKTAIDWSGFHIEIAYASTNSASALDYILEYPVDIVITDVSMPNINGLQLIQRIKKGKPSVYVIVLSAYSNFEYARTALRYGAENYLLKPLDPDELCDTISQIISHIREREQLSSTYGRTMLTFRNAFTEQWLKNMLANNDLATKADILGINLDAPSFTVVIFSCTKSPAMVMSRFFDLFLEYLPGHYTGNFFFETPLKLVGVLSPVGTAGERINSFLTMSLKAASAAGCPIFACVGQTVTHYSKVHQSYHQADSLSYFEYTNISCMFYQGSPQLAENAKEALSVYDQSRGNDTTAICKLYDTYEPAAAAAHLLSDRIHSFCKHTHELGDKYPELALLLASWPGHDADKDALLTFSLTFLQSSDYLLSKIQQSMYPVVNAVIKTVHEFTDKDISLKTLAARLNVNPSYLGTIFYQQTGYHFNDYLAEARLKYAAELLEHTDMKIKDIVDKTGFSSQTYFNRSFKRYYDTSPLNYRRNKKVVLF